MNIISIQGEDNINILCNEAMRSTLVALHNEGKITFDDYENFMDNHIAVFCPNDGGWKAWLKRIFKGNDPKTIVVVCKTHYKIEER